MPRTTDLDDEKIRQVKELANRLLSPESIADILGVTSRTVRRWKEQGRQDIELGETETLHARFVRALREGMADAEQDVVAGMMASLAMGKPAAGKFLLTHHPELRKRWKTEEVALDDALKVVLGHLLQGNQEVARKLLDAAIEASREPSSEEPTE